MISAVERAHNGMINIEEASQEQLGQLQARFRHQAEAANVSGDIDAADVHQQVAAVLANAKADLFAAVRSASDMDGRVARRARRLPLAPVEGARPGNGDAGVDG